MLIPIILATPSDDVCFFEDNFDYTDSIFNHDWTWVGGRTNIPPIDNKLELESESISKTLSTPISTGIYNGTVSFRFNDLTTANILRYALSETTEVTWDFIFSLANRSDKCETYAPCVSYMDNDLQINIKNVTGDEWVNISFIINLDTDRVVFYNGTDFSGEILLNTSSPIDKIRRLDLYSFSLLSDWDNINIGCGGIPEITCEYPLLFCDNFDYERSMSERDWLVYEYAGLINTTFAPIDDKLDLTQEKQYFPFHETDVFDVSYFPDSIGAFTKHYYAPVFSTEFKLLVNNITDGGFSYAAFEKQYIPAYYIYVDVDSNGSLNWSYANETQPSLVRAELCNNCGVANITYDIKINSFFAQRDNFPFNSSITDDEIKVYMGGELIGTIEDFLSPRIEYISQYEIIKASNYKFIIDDYYVMVGTDQSTYTGEQYYTDFYDNRTTAEETPLGEGVGDMAASLADIWYDMGLRSGASKIMAGLFLMFFIALIMYGVSASYQVSLSPAVLIIVELFFMLLLTYIRLLPIWLPFVVVLIAAGIGALIVKMGSSQ